MSCFGGSESSQQVVTPKAGPFEGKFLGAGWSMLPAILEAQGFTLSETPQAGKKGKVIGSDISIARRPLTPEEQQRKNWEEQLGAQAQGVLTGGGLNLSPEVLAMVSQIYDQQQNLAQQQIQRTATSAAGARGLNITDTPIGDPFLRATGESAAAIRAAQAQAMLGLRENELSRAGGQVSYLDALKQQRSFANPLAFANFAGGLGASLYGSRMGGTRVTGQMTSDTGVIPGLADLAGGVGGLLTGLGKVK